MSVRARLYVRAVRISVLAWLPVCVRALMLHWNIGLVNPVLGSACMYYFDGNKIVNDNMVNGDVYLPVHH